MSADRAIDGGMGMTTCKGCGREIKWLRTEAGKQMPVDPEPVTVVLTDGRVFRGYRPHWATCPKAEQFRRKGEAKS
ncbi:MAG: hypothetical protein ACM309_09680 [Bacillota bacterium]